MVFFCHILMFFCDVKSHTNTCFCLFLLGIHSSFVHVNSTKMQAEYLKQVSCCWLKHRWSIKYLREKITSQSPVQQGGFVIRHVSWAGSQHNQRLVPGKSMFTYSGFHISFGSREGDDYQFRSTSITHTEMNLLGKHSLKNNT